jgi:predicted Rossmann fold nucleotide-binding protein DprA/Smf involved in DNA uptake
MRTTAPRVTTIDAQQADFPAALRNKQLIVSYPRLWALGHLGILDMPLVGLFCSTRCSGNVIVHTYDLARALRDAEVPVISGFHTPMEKECLDVLLRGRQPVVVCPARSIERLRLPMAWRQPLAEERLLVLSPFGASHRRPTTALAEQRNSLVATLADAICIAHAAAGSHTERLSTALVARGKRTSTLHLTENNHLMQYGIVGKTVHDLVDALRILPS